MTQKRQKKIAVINDFSGYGRCSITVSLPIISVKKIQCCPVPTAIFSNHTGYDSFYCNDYTEHMQNFIDEWKKLNLSFDGIYTGFLGSEHQIDIVKKFLNDFKKDNTLVIIDPVMGDNGKLYPTYSNSLKTKMFELVKYADILTPNLTEACFLTNTEYSEHISKDDLLKMCEVLSLEGPKKIVISGILLDNNIGNFIYEKGKKPRMLKVCKLGDTRAGTGDVFASIISAECVNNTEFFDAVKIATDFISKCIDYTNTLGIDSTDGVCFEQFLTEL